MKVVYDTCLYVDLLRQGGHLSLFSDRNHVRFLSPLVLMELKAGAITPKHRKIVDQLIEPYSRVGRIIAMPAGIFSKSGEVLSRLHKARQNLGRGLINDLLIALGARKAMARIVTCDKKDFQIIASYVSIDVAYW